MSEVAGLWDYGLRITVELLHQMVCCLSVEGVITYLLGQGKIK